MFDNEFHLLLNEPTFLYMPHKASLSNISCAVFDAHRKFEDTHKMQHPAYCSNHRLATQQLERGSSLIVFLKLIDYSLCMYSLRACIFFRPSRKEDIKLLRSCFLCQQYIQDEQRHDRAIYFCIMYASLKCMQTNIYICLKSYILICIYIFCQ